MYRQYIIGRLRYKDCEDGLEDANGLALPDGVPLMPNHASRFASIEDRFPRWFDPTHYDEYDRWAYDKWDNDKNDNASVFTFENRCAQAPDIYTLMKRRYATIVEDDECRENSKEVMEADGYRNDEDYSAIFGSNHRPRSGGRSYGAGAFGTLVSDPRCTFGRQRMSVDTLAIQKADLLPSEAVMKLSLIHI